MFDLDIVREAARESGFAVAQEDQRSVAVTLAEGCVLVFANGDDDEAIYIKDGGSWHSHGDLFAGYYKTDVELVPSFVLADLRRGLLLISKHVFRNGQIDVSLVFADQIGDVNYYLGAGEEITFRKLNVMGQRSTT